MYKVISRDTYSYHVEKGTGHPLWDPKGELTTRDHNFIPRSDKRYEPVYNIRSNLKEAMAMARTELEGEIGDDEVQATAVRRLFGEAERVEALNSAFQDARGKGVRFVLATDGVLAEVLEALDLVGLLHHFVAVVARLTYHGEDMNGEGLYTKFGLENKADLLDAIGVANLFDDTSANFETTTGKHVPGQVSFNEPTHVPLPRMCGMCALKGVTALLLIWASVDAAGAESGRTACYVASSAAMIHPLPFPSPLFFLSPVPSSSLLRVVDEIALVSVYMVYSLLAIAFSVHGLFFVGDSFQCTWFILCWR